MKSWKTTLFGVAIAVLTYIQGVGEKLPETRQEWITFAISVALVAFSAAAKDFDVHSTEDEVAAATLKADEKGAELINKRR